MQLFNERNTGKAPKDPRVLQRQLGVTEGQILRHLKTYDFVGVAVFFLFHLMLNLNICLPGWCAHAARSNGTTPFWQKHCHTVTFIGKDSPVPVLHVSDLFHPFRDHEFLCSGKLVYVPAASISCTLAESAIWETTNVTTAMMGSQQSSRFPSLSLPASSPRGSTSMLVNSGVHCTMSSALPSTTTQAPKPLTSLWQTCHSFSCYSTASGMRQRGRRGSSTWRAWCGLQPSSPKSGSLMVRPSWQWTWQTAPQNMTSH